MIEEVEWGQVHDDRSDHDPIFNQQVSRSTFIGYLLSLGSRSECFQNPARICTVRSLIGVLKTGHTNLLARQIVHFFCKGMCSSCEILPSNKQTDAP